MSYKVQYKVNGSRIIGNDKFPYNQIREVSKKVFDYIKATFPEDFNLFEPATKKATVKVAEERAEKKEVGGFGAINKTEKSRRRKGATPKEGW